MSVLDQYSRDAERATATARSRDTARMKRLWTSVPLFTPYVAGAAPVEWIGINGHFVFVEPEVTIEVTSIRFSIIVGVGAGDAGIAFGLYESSHAQLPPSVDNLGLTTVINATLLQGSTRRWSFTRTIAIYDRNIEILYDTPLTLTGGKRYVIGLIADQGAGDLIYAPSAAIERLALVTANYVTAPAVMPRDIEIAPTIANSGTHAGLFELRDRETTHVHSGGADFRRW